MYAEFYEKHIVGAVRSGNLITGLCPFHDDGKQSFSAYADTGRWACFGSCGIKSRTPEEFLQKKLGISITEAAAMLTAEGIKPPDEEPKRGRGRPAKQEQKYVPTEEVEAAHKRLLDSKTTLVELTNKRLWSLEVIKEFKIGLGVDNRVWIPVSDGAGKYLDVRRYDWNHATQQKFLAYGQGFGGSRMWPHDPRPDEHVILLEGEPDTLLARSLGINAYTSTGGASSVPRFVAKRTTVLFDADEAGRKGAEKVLVQQKGQEIRAAEFPPWEGMPANADFTDWVRTGIDTVTVHELIEKTWRDEEDTAPKVTLAQAVLAKNFGRLLKVSATACGKNLSPYQVPKRGIVVCPQGQKVCGRCGIEGSGGRHEFEIQRDSAKMIECTDNDSAKVRSILREHLGIPKFCSVAEIETKEVQNLYSVRLTSLVDIDAGNDKTPYVAIQAWSTENIDLNTPFVLTARATPDPKTQSGTLIIVRVESDRTSIDDFELTQEQLDALRVFQPKGGTNAENPRHADADAVSGNSGRQEEEPPSGAGS